MKLGIISDTHGHFDPNLLESLRGVDEILHAGDVGTADVLDQLRVVAPVHAVRGNVDPPELGLAPTFTRRFGRVSLHMLHVLPQSQSTIRDWALAGSLEGKAAAYCRRFLDSFPEACRIVIFGHSHEPCALVLEGKLFFNPGSAGKKRFSLPRCCGVLEITATAAHATFLGLERYNELPEGAWLPLEGV